MTWSVPNRRSAVWQLDNTPMRVWAPQDAKTFVVMRLNSAGNMVTVKRGFRKLASAQAYAEQFEVENKLARELLQKMRSTTGE